MTPIIKHEFLRLGACVYLNFLHRMTEDVSSMILMRVKEYSVIFLTVNFFT